MKKIKNIFALLVVALAGLSLTACSEDDLDTNQYQSGVVLNVYGPSPLMRGGMLRFLGSNLDQVAQVEIPGIAAITDIEVIKSGVPSEIRVAVPHDGPQEGFVKLITKSGQELITKTELRFTQGLNPANITMPAQAKAGDRIRITVPETSDEYLDIIHMVEFADGSTLAQLGPSDMRIPIQYALSYPERWESPSPRIDYCQEQPITFGEADEATFGCLALAREAGRIGGTMPCVLNAANEVANAAFRRGACGFLDVEAIVRHAVEAHDVEHVESLGQLEEIDQWARGVAREALAGLSR